MEQTLSVKHHAEQLVFATPNKLARYRAITFSDKEPETLEWIDGFSPDSVLWDIGANVGLYSIYAAKKGAKVMAFEPSIFNLELLGRNSHLNGVSDDIVILPFPVNDQLGANMMNLGGTQWGGAMSTFGRNIGFDGKPFHPSLLYQIFGISGDDAIRLLQLPSPTHIKLDVDGNECLVLKGLSVALAGAESILIEVNDFYEKQAVEVASLLEESGFVLTEKRHAAMFDNSERFSGIYNQIWRRTISQ